MTNNTYKKELVLARHGMSGLLLLPLLAWFIISLTVVLNDPFESLPVFFFSPVNAVFGIFFVMVVFYHLNFEVKYIVGDYIKNVNLQNSLMLLVDLISTITAVCSVLTILQIHFTGIIIAP